MAANGAKVLGALREPGRVKATKLVDLAVIQGDLAANPAAAWRTVTPFKDRIGYDSAKPFAAAQGQVGAR